MFFLAASLEQHLLSDFTVYDSVAKTYSREKISQKALVYMCVTALIASGSFEITSHMFKGLCTDLELLENMYASLIVTCRPHLFETFISSLAIAFLSPLHHAFPLFLPLFTFHLPTGFWMFSSELAVPSIATQTGAVLHISWLGSRPPL